MADRRLTASPDEPAHLTPDATIARLPVYLRVLGSLADDAITTVSSGALAEAAGLNSAQVRKDLSYLGSYGTRGVGYDVEYLRFQIGRELGFAQQWPVVIVGLGNLGRALAGYAGFGSRGFRVVALVDADPALAGTTVDGLPITPLAELEAVVGSSRARIAVIATPGAAAQSVCDRLVAAGVSSILNFAPSILVTPPQVTVRKVDLGQELQILAYHEQRRLDPVADSAVDGQGLVGVGSGAGATDPGVAEKQQRQQSTTVSTHEGGPVATAARASAEEVERA